MALQPFDGPWPLFQFLNPIHSREDTLDEGSDRRNTNIYTLSGIRTHDPSVRASEDSSCIRPRDHCDRQFVRSPSLYLRRRFLKFNLIVM
jgi:hypothetical protein